MCERDVARGGQGITLVISDEEKDYIIRIKLLEDSVVAIGVLL